MRSLVISTLVAVLCSSTVSAQQLVATNKESIRKLPTSTYRLSQEKLEKKIAGASSAEYAGRITVEDMLTKRDQYLGKVVELKFYAGSVTTSLGETRRLLVHGKNYSCYDYLFLCGQEALTWAVKTEKSRDFLSGMPSTVYVLVDEKNLIALGDGKAKKDDGYSYTFGKNTSLTSEISSSNSVLKSNSASDLMRLPKDELKGKIAEASFAEYKGSVTIEDIILNRGRYLGAVVEVKFLSASLYKSSNNPYLYITGGESSAGSFHLFICDQEALEWASDVIKKPYGASRTVYALVEETGLIALGTRKRSEGDGYSYRW